MRTKLISGLAGLALAIPLALLAPGTASAVDGCNNGDGSGSFTLQAGQGTTNTNYAWRFRTIRNSSSGNTVVNAYSAAGTMTNSFNGQSAWVGRWSTNYPNLATSEGVTNSTGPVSTFDYNRSCSKV